PALEPTTCVTRAAAVAAVDGRGVERTPLAEPHPSLGAHGRGAWTPWLTSLMVLVYNLSMLVTRSTSLPQAASRTVGALNTRFLDVDGGRVAYDVAGTGPVVVMLPGLGDLRQEYRFLAPLLAEAGYRVATA